MSYTIADAAILSATSGLTTSSKMVLIVLAQHADTGGLCWPGIARIAELSCLSERATRYAIRKLEDLGLLAVQYRLGRSTHYTLALKPLRASKKKQPTPADVAPPPRQFLPRNQPSEPLQRIHCAPPSAVPKQPPRPQPATAPAAPLCVPDELKTIEPQTLEDFAVVRKAKKKAPMPTRTEVQELVEQAERAGMTVAQAVRLCIVRGWSRFEAAWIHDKRSAQAATEAIPTKSVEVWKPEPVNAVPPPPEIRARLAALRSQMVANIQGTMLKTGATA